MKLKKICFGNFKSLYDVSFDPGRVNVFVGANGAGKTTLLEAIGLLSAAMTDRVDSTSLQRRGVRLSVPTLYKSNFKDISHRKPTIHLSLEWESDGQEIFSYDVNLTSPTDSELWKYHSETFFCNGEKKWGRSNASSQSRNPAIGGFLVDDNKILNLGRKMASVLSNYGIFQPNTMTLRGTVADPNQTTPIGLNGGRLAEAISDLIRTEDEDVFFGNMYIEDVLDLIDWASEITVNAPKKSSINANIPTTRQIIEFTDRYMKNSAKFTAYDASEGALYVLFMLALAMHPQGPNIFAIDSFDHALNPRLARKLTATFCEQIIQNQKCVFLTTHNPLVLDGLDLNNNDIRLFAIDRNLDGYAQITRIKVSQELIKEGQPLSRLWINDRLGGVPPLL